MKSITLWDVAVLSLRYLLTFRREVLHLSSGSNNKAIIKQAYIVLCKTACSVHSLTLKIEAIGSSERSVNFYQDTRRHILDDSFPKALICLCLDNKMQGKFIIKDI
jgi:hypothetical protein